MTLAEFLLARIDQDEGVAQAAIDAGADLSHIRDNSRDLDVESARFVLRFHAERILAECDAKRQLVREADVLHADFERLAGGLSQHLRVIVRDRILTELALPYADHPDYREEWKP